MRYFWTGCMGMLLGSWLFWNMAYIFPVKQVMVVTDGLYSPPGVFDQAIASAFPFGYVDNAQKIRQVVEKAISGTLVAAYYYEEASSTVERRAEYAR